MCTFGKKFGNQLTQLDIQYKNCPTIDYAHESNILQSGLHAPDDIKTRLVALARSFRSNCIVHESFNVKKPAVYLIRPDTYIAYCSDTLTIESMGKFCNDAYLRLLVKMEKILLSDEEVKNPKKFIPRAIVATILYISVARSPWY